MMFDRLWDTVLVWLGFRVPRWKREAATRQIEWACAHSERMTELQRQLWEIERPYRELQARLRRGKRHRMRYGR